VSEDDEKTHPGADAPVLERIAASLAVLHRSNAERSELSRAALIAQTERDLAATTRTKALISIIQAPGAIIDALTRGNKTAQTVLAIGVVIFALVLLGVQVAEIDVNRLILGLFGQTP